jgi:hypothetical protein
MDDDTHLANGPFTHDKIGRPGDLPGQKLDLDPPRRGPGGHHQDAGPEASGSGPGGQLRAHHAVPPADQPTEGHTPPEGGLVENVAKHGPEPAPFGWLRPGRDVGVHGPIPITSG